MAILRVGVDKVKNSAKVISSKSIDFNLYKLFGLKLNYFKLYSDSSEKSV